MRARSAQDPTRHWALRSEFDHLDSIQRHVCRALSAHSGRQNLICLCNSYALTVLAAVSACSFRENIRVSVVENDPGTAQALRERARALDVVLDVVTGDAGSGDTYLDAVPATVVVASGALCTIATGSMGRTTSAIRRLCADRSTVVWSHTLVWPGRARAAQRLFDSDGFTEIDTDRVGEGALAPGWLIGSSRIAALPHIVVVGRVPPHPLNQARPSRCRVLPGTSPPPPRAAGRNPGPATHR